MPVTAVPQLTFAAALLAAMAVGGGAALADTGRDGRQSPAWAFDPAAPGPDAPPAGRSLFDRLFAAPPGERGPVAIPYPFAELRRQLLERMGAETEAREVLAEVLIPLGRALQREAAAPNYFASPRLVLAVVGEPQGRAEGARPALGLRLKDRLYIGYQERAESLEVISYNEAVGRFEFQIVEDYAPGRRPRVLYAQRAVCLACHQNGGPIFSEPPWGETNANPDVARRLAEEASAFHGVAAAAGNRPFDQAFAISRAVERANAATAHQRIWREGCGAGTAAIPCRAGLLTAALQYKLSGGRHFDATSGAFRAAAARLDEAWAQAWPSGLAVPAALIANRDPLVDGPEVTPAFDPLTARPALEVWAGPQPKVLRNLVAGLARFFSSADAAHLDRRLRALADEAPQDSRRTLCAVSRRGLEDWGERYLFRCAGHEPGGPLLDGHFYRRSSSRLEGGISWLAVDDDRGTPARFEEVAISAEADDALTLADGTARVAFRLSDRQSGLSLRLPDGRAVASLSLSWRDVVEDTTDPSAQIPDYPPNGKAELTLERDFAPLHEALATLVERAEDGRDALLSDGAFRGARAMAAILASLGADRPCCAEDDGILPPPAVERAEARPAAGARAIFTTYCAACHSGPGAFPPNFLHGPDEAAEAGLERCAARISYRLTMWDRPQAARTKSPMPPESWLLGRGLHPEAWRASAQRAALSRRASDLLTHSGDSREEVMRRGREAYEALPPCLGLGP